MLGAFVGAFAPSDDASSPLRSVDIWARANETLGAMPGAVAWGLRLSLWIVWLAPLVTGDFSTFTGLSGARRESLLERWDRLHFVPLRYPYLAVKILVTSLVYEDPAVARAIGYEAGCST